MILPAFLNFYEQCQHSDLSFEYFRTEILPLITPKKLKLNPKDNTKDLVVQLRDAIISNLGFNPYFYKFDFKYEDLVNIPKILLNSESSTLSQNQFIQLIFLLHLSKANIDDKNTWKNFFLILETIKIIDTNECVLKNELSEFLHQLKKCNKFTDKILAVGQEISGIQKIDTNFADLKINFISSSIQGLNGYSGINSIYIDLTELSRKHRILKSFLDENKALNLLKFECLRLFVHETCHVLIRQSLKDLNISSPGLPEVSKKYSLPEAGVMAEEKIFSHRIDWIISIKNFNYDYCLEYLTNILMNQDVNFDFEKANCAIDTRKMYQMAIDYKIPIPCFY